MILLCRYVVQCVRKEMKNSPGNDESSADSAEEDKVGEFYLYGF